MTKPDKPKKITVAEAPKPKKAVAPRTKKLSNSASTGGAGNNYEARVGAVYLLAMYGGLAPAVYPEAKVTGLYFQAKIHGYETDDLVCITEDPIGATHKVLIQVKRSVKANASDMQFMEAITAAWIDFNNSEVFTPGVDRIALVYDEHLDSDLRGAVSISEFARSSLTGHEFFLKSTKENFSSDANRKAYKAILAIVTDIAGGPVCTETFQQFVRHIRFVPHALSSDTTAEFAQHLNFIQLILGDVAYLGPHAVWTELVDACQKLKEHAGSISFTNLDEQISSRIAAKFRSHREGTASGLSLAQLSPAAIQTLGRSSSATPSVGPGTALPTFSTMPGISSTTSPVEELSAARPGSANKVISTQLDAISEKLKKCLYLDALEDLRTLGKDLGPFDDHQRARWYQQRGVCSWHLGREKDAADDFIRAADLSSDDEKMVAARIRGLMLLKRNDAAIEAGEAAVQRFPVSLHVWLATANARLIRGDKFEITDVPSSLRNEADALQLLAWSKHFQGLHNEAMQLSLEALESPSKGFFTRHTALAITAEAAMKDDVLCFYGLLKDEVRNALVKVTDEFAPRIEKLWNVQASATTTTTATYLGCAYLLLDLPEEALTIADEAKARGIASAGLLRVELDALGKLGRFPEMLKFGHANVSKFSADGLVRLAQEAGNLGDLSLVDTCVKSIKDLYPEDVNATEILQAIRWMSYLRTPKKAEIIDEVKNAGLDTSNSLQLLAAGARVLLRSEDVSCADALIERAKIVQKEAESVESTLILAELLFEAKRFNEAIPYYVDVLPKKRFSELHDRLLCCYIKAGSAQKAKQLLESFPAEWIDNDDTRSLAIELGQMAGDWRMLTTLADTQFKKTPLHISSWLFKFMVDVRRKSVSELQAFLSTAPMDLKGSIQQTSQLAGLELRYGLEDNGMQRMYRMRRLNIDNVESASALILTFVSGRELLPNMEEQLAIAGPGTSLILNDDKKTAHTLTIDPDTLPGLPTTNEFKPASDSYAQRFIGTKLGDIVTIDAGFGTTRTFTVMAISSAYRRLHQSAFTAVNESVTPVPNLVSFSMPTTPDGDTDFSEILAQLQRSSAHGRVAMQQYETLPLTLGCLAHMLGKKPIDLIRFWPEKGPALVCCDGTIEERKAAFSLLEDTTLAYVIDSATLAELVFLDSSEVLAQFSKLYITELSRDILQGMLDDAKRSRSAGHAYDDDGRLGFIEYTEATHKREIAQFEAILASVEKYCEVCPSYGPENPNKVLLGLKDLLSAEEFSSLLLAAEKGSALITVDGHLRQWATASDIRSVWPQVVLMQGMNAKILTNGQYALATAKLFMANRTFTSLNDKDILTLCLQSDKWLQFGFNKFAQHLGARDTEFATARSMAFAFLKRVAVYRPTLGVFAEFVRHVVQGLLRHPECPENLLEDLYTFLDELLAPYENIADSYPPNLKHRQREHNLHLKFVMAAAQEGASWAKEPWRDRDIRIKVLNCGVVPQLVSALPT